MVRRRIVGLACIISLIGACSTPPTAERERKRSSPPYNVALGEYKLGVAHRIVQKSPDTYSTPMPQVMKSIVVLEITVDPMGQPTAVSVYRSNGYVELEERAAASVLKAAPFAPPAPDLLQGRSSFSFLETFLFRDDDFFQVRSLVPDKRLPPERARLF